MNGLVLLSAVIFGGLFLWTVAFDDAAGAAFAKYDGIDGESKDSNHDKWIDVLSIDWGVHRPGGTTGSGSAKGDVVVQDMFITMEYDKASPKIQEKILKGEVIPKLELELTATYGGARATYLHYELTNVMVTSYQTNASGNDEAGPPTVVVGNNFEEIKVTYTEYDDGGSAKDVIQTSYRVGRGTR